MNFFLRRKTWLELAEVFDAWRVVPRAILAGYGYLIWDMWQWVASRPDLTTQQGLFAGAIIGMGVPLAGFYFNSGRKWERGSDGG